MRFYREKRKLKIVAATHLLFLSACLSGGSAWLVGRQRQMEAMSEARGDSCGVSEDLTVTGDAGGASPARGAAPAQDPASGAATVSTTDAPVGAARSRRIKDFDSGETEKYEAGCSSMITDKLLI